VTGLIGGHLIVACGHLFQAIPLANVVLGNTIKLSWLNNTFPHLSNDVMDNVVVYYAQAHILTLIGSLLMPNTSGNKVNLMYLLQLA